MSVWRFFCRTHYATDCYANFFVIGYKKILAKVKPTFREMAKEKAEAEKLAAGEPTLVQVAELIKKCTKVCIPGRHQSLYTNHKIAENRKKIDIRVGQYGE